MEESILKFNYNSTPTIILSRNSTLFPTIRWSRCTRTAAHLRKTSNRPLARASRPPSPRFIRPVKPRAQSKRTRNNPARYFFVPLSRACSHCHRQTRGVPVNLARTIINPGRVLLLFSPPARACSRDSLSFARGMPPPTTAFPGLMPITPVAVWSPRTPYQCHPEVVSQFSSSCSIIKRAKPKNRAKAKPLLGESRSTTMTLECRR